MRVIQISEHGGPEVLRIVEQPIPQPAAGQVVVQNQAIGVNYVDVQHRQGGYYPVHLPLIPGIEAAGIIHSVGTDVIHFKPGDRVAYAGYMGGNYADYTAVAETALVHVPDKLDFVQAAAGLMQGMTAHCLTHDVFHTQAGHWVLVQAAAGGVGSLLVQFAKRRGARVIGTVSSTAKAEFARAQGADHVINYQAQNVVEAVNAITAGLGVHVVYDAVGQATFEHSLASLRACGHMIIYGQTSGPIPPFDINRLSGLTAGGSRGSISITWAALSHYNAELEMMRTRAQAVFDLIHSQALRVHISHQLSLEQAAEAHRLLESRDTTGKVILLP
jgi:NADPH2:quinone reductase